ncbi:uncharacterized protein LOC126095428 [Schistocerca cancellata]|uniref:uncharacterized protein LOC126095428 n=1 Tax=Schistocerca cancellata TaxID=274614 RepID=UPI002118A106|nr:uncharacterized protein LOC126095428 [Schistocerca cancellata]
MESAAYIFAHAVVDSSCKQNALLFRLKEINSQKIRQARLVSYSTKSPFLLSTRARRSWCYFVWPLEEENATEGGVVRETIKVLEGPSKPSLQAHLGLGRLSETQRGGDHIRCSPRPIMELSALPGPAVDSACCRQ